MNHRVALLCRLAWIALIVADLSSGCDRAADRERFDWPRWRGQDGNGISRETGWDPEALENGAKILWKKDIGSGFSNVTIVDSRLYTMGWGPGPDNNIYCLEAGSGHELWRFSYPGYGFPQATPTVDGASAYCLTKDNLLICLDARSGTLRWQKDLVAEYGVVKPNYGFAGSPVVEGDLLILNANTSGMALDKITGKKVWGSASPPDTAKYFDSTGTEYHSPVLFSKQGKRYALVSSYKGLFAVEVRTGTPRLLFDWESSYIDFRSQIADPLVFEKKVMIVGAVGRHFGSVALDLQGQETGTLWESKDTFSELGSPIYYAGFLYVCQGGGNSKGFLRCLDPSTGLVKWEERLAGGKGQDSVSLTAADGKLIVLNDKGQLFIAEASAEGWQVISSVDVLAGEKKPRKFWTPPVLCNGRIYCRNFSGDLVCIDVSK